MVEDEPSLATAGAVAGAVAAARVEGAGRVVVEEACWLFAVFAMLGLLDLRFDPPKPRFLNRELIKSVFFICVLDENEQRTKASGRNSTRPFGRYLEGGKYEGCACEGGLAQASLFSGERVLPYLGGKDG